MTKQMVNLGVLMLLTIGTASAEAKYVILNCKTIKGSTIQYEGERFEHEDKYKTIKLNVKHNLYPAPIEAVAINSIFFHYADGSGQVLIEGSASMPMKRTLGGSEPTKVKLNYSLDIPNFKFAEFGEAYDLKGTLRFFNVPKGAANIAEKDPEISIPIRCDLSEKYNPVGLEI